MPGKLSGVIAMGDKASRENELTDNSSNPSYQLLIDALAETKAGRTNSGSKSGNSLPEFTEHFALSAAERKEIHTSNSAKSIIDAKDMIAKLPEGDKAKVDIALDKLRWSESANRAQREKDVLQALGPAIAEKVIEAKSELKHASEIINFQKDDIYSRSSKIFSKSAINCHQSANTINGFDLQFLEMEDKSSEKVWKQIDPIYEKSKGIRNESIPRLGSEFAETALKLFPRLDLNEDGKLSKIELVSALRDPVYKGENAQVVGALYMNRDELSQLGSQKSNDKSITQENIKSIDAFLATQQKGADDLKELLNLTWNHGGNRFKALFPREEMIQSLKDCKDPVTVKAINEALEKIPDGPLGYHKISALWKEQLSENPTRTVMQAIENYSLATSYLKSNPDLLNDGVVDECTLSEHLSKDDIDPETETALNQLMERNGGIVSLDACEKLLQECKDSADAKFVMSMQFLENHPRDSYFETSEIRASLNTNNVSEETKAAFDRAVSGMGPKIDEKSILAYMRKFDADPAAEVIDDLNRSCRKAAFSQEKSDCYDLYGPGGADENINADAVNQSSFGNCYLAAALSSVAESRPGIISQMIKENSDGTYTVTFRGDPKHPITVPHPTESMLAIGMEATKHGVWPRVIEEAFGEYCRRHDSHAEQRHEPIDLEVSGNGGNPAAVLRLLTGQKYNLVSLESVKDLNKLVEDLRVRSEPTVLSTNRARKSQPDGFASNHAYTLRLRPEVKALRVRNPWGGDDNTVKGNMLINPDKIRRNFDGITVPVR